MINLFKKLLKILVILVTLSLIYLFFLNRDISKIDDFCSEMVEGLDVKKVHLIAEKYDVGLKSVKDPNSVKNQSLGIKLKDKENTWFFTVAAPMSMGEHACSVHHDNNVVLSAESGI